LGYESRQLTREQFRDDTVDAGEIGSGQSVTALYELDMMQSMAPVPYLGSVRGRVDERWLAVVRVRYRRVDNGRIEEIEQRIYERDIATSFDAASPRFRLAVGVAAFAEILRGSPFAQGVGFPEVAEVLRPVALALHLDSRIRELAQIVETAGGLAR
jgi:Ca-activated chloride channel homolog